MRLTLLAVIVLAGAAAPPGHWRETALTQLAMNDGAGGELKAAEGELAAAYQEAVEATTVDSPQRELLAASQRAWEAYAEAQMALLYGCEPAQNGSARPMCWALDKAALVQQRTAALRELLARGVEEDICWWRRPCEPPTRKR